MRNTGTDRIKQILTECRDADIRILPGNESYDRQEWMKSYLLDMDADAMLYNFRTACGLDVKGAEPLYGWEAPDGKLRGHTTGHFLSALALCFHATGDEMVRTKAEYMIHELAICQEAFQKISGIHEGFLSAYDEEQFDLLEVYTPYPEIWAPYYTMHKIMAGLLDCFTYLKSKEAFEIVIRMGHWVADRVLRLPREQRKKMWSLYIAGEFGGMNEVMARLYGLTGEEKFLACAKAFDNEKLFVPMMRYAGREDGLDGMHANQHIPQIIGALEIYRQTGEEKYLKVAGNFWKTVTENRAFAPGGVGEGEMFREFGVIAGILTDKTMESCASYNMLKLTKQLFELHPDARYMDYYERTLFNHILAVPAHDTSGESTYFLPLAPGGQRGFLREMSCCHGTCMENPFRYREGIYSRSADGDYYINLYIPSELNAESDDPDGHVKICIERLSLRGQRFRIRVSGRGMGTCYFRKPYWAETFSVCEDGKELALVPDERGYLPAEGSFAKERKFEVTFKPALHFERAPDQLGMAAIFYGPYVMAFLSESRDHLVFAEEDIRKYMKADLLHNDSDNLHQRINEIKCFPLYEIDKIRYHVYVCLSS